jgi:hypothetical protein
MRAPRDAARYAPGHVMVSKNELGRPQLQRRLESKKQDARQEIDT